MKLVIFATSQPPDKAKWADPNQTARGEWSEIYEAITNWFCFSNGIRKELNVDILLPEITLSIKGDGIRYLAPPLRSVASLLWNGYYKTQPGIEKKDTKPIENYETPYYFFHEDSGHTSTIDVYGEGTLFLNPPDSVVEKLVDNRATKIPVLGRFNSQKLVWLLYND